VVTRDPRGVGQSTRRGPYDIDTDTDDMGALVEEVGHGVVVSAGANASCVRVAAERPQLIEAVVLASSIVELQFQQGEMDSLAGSESVVEAGLKQLRVDPRPVLRTIVSISNPQLSDAEAGERVAAQVAYCPPDAAQERAEASVLSDDLTRTGPSLGDRLWIIYFENPLSPRELLKRARDLLPEAHIVEAEDGPISRPHHRRSGAEDHRATAGVGGKALDDRFVSGWRSPPARTSWDFSIHVIHNSHLAGRSQPDTQFGIIA
jgi:pimeloyl-ACP methyl ester carboxylesterase